MYIYKEKNKFPHIICISVDSGDPKFKEITHWLRNNIGVYRKGWFCPSSFSRYIANYEDSWTLWPYAFKTVESALAFKLRWT